MRHLNPFITTVSERYRVAREQVEEEYREEIEREIRSYLKQFEFHLLHRFGEVRLTTSTKGRVAAYAYSWQNRICINPVLFLENREDFLDQTIPHEVAHIVADKYYKKDCAHGNHWKLMMAKIGKPADRCHQYDTSKSKMK